MKKLILILCITFYISMDAQQYVPFPTNNASWSEIHIQQGYCEPYGCKTQYKILGDTTINSVLYHKIYEQDDPLQSSVGTFYIGGMREMSKKIFFLSKYCNQEIRLYDFSKNVGDTIRNISTQYSCNADNSRFSTITKIDSILIDGNYRKVFHFDNYLYDNHVWIEGIGSTYGLLKPSIDLPTCICTWDLVCFHQDNVLKYLNPTYNTCFPIIDNLNNPTSSSTISISPNPVIESSLVKWEIPENNRYATFMITDVLGKNIKTINVSGKTEININRRDFAKGLYVGKLVSSTGYEATVKIIVQ